MFRGATASDVPNFKAVLPYGSTLSSLARSPTIHRNRFGDSSLVTLRSPFPQDFSYVPSRHPLRDHWKVTFTADLHGPEKKSFESRNGITIFNKNLSLVCAPPPASYAPAPQMRILRALNTAMFGDEDLPVRCDSGGLIQLRF